MAEKPLTYKSNQIIESLPSCTLDTTYLKKLYQILEEVTLEAAGIEVSKLKKKPREKMKDFKKFKKDVHDLYKVSIQIWGAKGEYFYSETPSNLEKTRLPDRINTVIFDSSVKYRFSLKLEPLNMIKIQFDFRKPKVFDFLSRPSEATPNYSSIWVTGNNDTWVSGAYRKAMESLKERSNKRGWLHKNNIYDLFIWFLIIPMSFRIIYKIDSIFGLRSGKASSVFIVALYLYFFIIALNVFRMIFNYARWVFPKIELITSLKRGAITHRGILMIIFLGLIIAVIHDLIKLLSILILQQ